MRHFILFIAGILLLNPLFAANEQYNSRIEGAQLNNPSNPLEIYDSRYFDMTLNPIWNSEYINYSVNNKITLGVRPDVIQDATFDAQVEIQVDYEIWNGTSFQSMSETRTLSVSYDFLDGTTQVDDLSTFVFSGAHKITVNIISITGVAFDVEDLFLEASIEVERYYLLDNLPVAGIEITESGIANEFIDFSWDTKIGAEYYEIEWVHFNDVGLDNVSSFNYDFYSNSTRISTNETHYKIPKIFDEGWGVFRIRPIGVHFNDITKRKDGTWSADEKNSLVYYVLNHPEQMFVIQSQYDVLMNWSHQIGYTENGKRMEAISFTDGLGRSRQTVANNPVTDQVVVSNIYYDEMGRPVVQDLPTPVDNDRLRHFEKFNRAEADPIANYGYMYFDNISNPDCVLGGTGFATNSGAGGYYSPLNQGIDGEDVNIPDAENYPFSRVTYLNDFTGRVSSTGGAGSQLNIGSGHETNYWYVSTNQNELNAIFGTEVGWYEHYQKIVTVDPNGQYYVQYLDMAGRVVASYMAGPSPQNLDELLGNDDFQDVVEIVVDGNTQTYSNNPPSTSVTTYEPIYQDDNYSFNYAFTAAQYDAGCANMCFDCVYDLTIKIVDECGIEKWHETQQINGQVFNDICDGTGFTPITHEVFLEEGVYAVTKILTVNQNSIDEYWCPFIDSYSDESCFNDLSSYFETEYLNEPFADCFSDDYSGVSNGNSLCDIASSMMLHDVSLGGQYALYDLNNGVYSASDVTSIFYGSPALYTTISYSSTIDIGSGPVSPGNLTMEEFITNFQQVWAQDLAINSNTHPEACYLNFCASNSASGTYDQDMLAISSGTTALSSGYFNPLNNSPGTNILNFPSTMVSNPDPFFTLGGGVSYFNDMATEMSQYMNIYDANGVLITTVTMWEYAIILSLNCSDFTNLSDVRSCTYAYGKSCDADLVWIAFRSLYLKSKASYEDLARKAACPNVNQCIGTTANSCTGPYVNKVPRFPNSNTVLVQNAGGGVTTINDILNNTSLTQSVADQITLDNCEQTAALKAAEWAAILSGCDFVGNNVNILTLENDLALLLAYSCDLQHPFGASTTPPGQTVMTSVGAVSSVNEILEGHLGTGYEDNLCTELLLSEPGPFTNNDVIITNNTNPLDICACDLFLEAEYEFYNNNTTNAASPEEVFMQNTGVPMEDINRYLCLCKDNLDPDIPWSSGYIWPSSANVNLAATNVTLPLAITCEDGCTVSCTDVNGHITTLTSRFSNFGETTLNYEIILTNYLNLQLNYTLGYQSYADFIGECDATPSDPYCKDNPVMDEWKNVMNLILFRGQIVTSISNKIDLLTQNIVYANSDMQNFTQGDEYWSTIDATTLTTNFGDANGSCSIVLTEPFADFSFEDILSFGEILSESNNCDGNYAFKVEAKYLDCGVLTTVLVDGVSNCWEVTNCVCSPINSTLCNEPYDVDHNNECYQPRLDELYQNALQEYMVQIDEAYIEFTDDYNNQCSAAFSTENFSYSGPTRRYQYTLFYYDQVGNLVKTIAPKGVSLMASTDNANINASRTSVINSESVGSVLPTHDYGTTYQYNSYNQLVTTTNPDHEGNTQFWYDRYGRIVASQNPVQALAGRYSYSLYDDYGRPVQVGQVETTVPLTEIILKADDLGTAFQTWVGSGLIFEVTITTYDGILSTTISNKFKSGSQQNLRLRVASVAYYTSVTAATDVTTDYESATHYSYDIHGNVVEQLQDIPMMAPVQQDIKSTQYEFELISGNVSKVTYQEEELDFFEHSYQYDDLNRLTEVFTSTDNVHYTREAHYHYYDYGPLARTEIGQYQVQGMDYAYTINGWLKGMNASTLNTSRDMGKDGTSGFLSSNTTIHNLFAKDVVGYTMGYFSGDYTSIGNSTMELDAAGSNFETQSIDLFNGNISNIVTSIVDMTTLGTAYKYDQLQRLKEMTAFYNNNSTNDWIGAVATNEYYNAYTYDENGNILTLQRNGTVASGLYMDNFAYKYDGVDNANMPNRSNRLNFVIDSGIHDATATSDDIKGADMALNNFEYDEIGQLIQDNSEGIEHINWRTGDKKIKSIIRAASDLTSPQVEFIYNPFGLRVLKIEKPRNNGAILPEDQWKYSYYSYDANGQVMAIYDVEMHAALKRATVEEFDIYGASRVGLLKSEKLIYYNGQPNYGNPSVKQNTLGDRYYEVTNHLGNVLAVVNDRKTVAAPGNGAVYVATVISASDFYPFGMLMPERSTSTDSYRYAYNGMEMDNEVSGNGNSYTTEFRQYDARLGRWKSLDPLMGVQPFQSPYQAFNNNPIFFTDPLGLIGGPYKETQKFDFENFENELPSSASKGTQINFSLSGTGSNGEYMPGNNISINYTFNGSQWDKKITFFEGPNNNGAPEIITYDDNPISGNENKTKETLANYLQDDYPNGPSYTNSSSGVTVSGGMASYSQNPTPSTELMGAEISENSPTPDNVVDELPMKSIPDLYAGEISLTTIVIENAIKFEGATKGIEVFSKFFSKANGVFGAVTNSIDVVNDVTTGTIDEHTYANGIQAVGYGIGTTLLFTPLAPIGGLILTVVGIADLIQWGVWDE